MGAGRSISWVRWGVGVATLMLVALALYAGLRIGFGRPFTINQLADRQTIAFALRNPELMTEIGLVDGTPLDRRSGKLDPIGVAQRDANFAFAARALHEVRAFDRARLGAQDRITYDILEDRYESLLAFRRFGWASSGGVFAIDQTDAENARLPRFLLAAHVIRNRRSAENYVRRLEAMGAQIDAATGEMQRQADAGVVPPIAIVERTIAVTQATIAPEPADNPLVTKLVVAPGLTPAQRVALVARAAAALRENVYPAYARLITALNAIAPRARLQADGLGRLRDGKALYALLLRQATTSEFTPEQVHRIGLDEVARISGEMDARLQALGMTEGAVGERMQALAERADQLVETTEAGRAAVLARYDALEHDLAARAPAWLGAAPLARPVVASLPAAQAQEGASVSYEPGSMDGTRPARLFVNLHAPGPRFAMMTRAFGAGGRHAQAEIARTQRSLPLVRRQASYPAYVEGWALYSEGLAAEAGLYRDDPLGDLGRLQSELFHAARLVVDTGLHAKGWSRDEAVAYMASATGMDDGVVAAEVDREMADPGLACAGAIGELKILDLRARARHALGARFDLKAFHAAVLGAGPAPLTVLEQAVDGWIAGARR